MTSQQIADDLAATVHQAVEPLLSLDAKLLLDRPAPDRWTIKEVIGHLVDSAANNHQRFVRAQFAGELFFPKYEQNQWIGCQAYNDIEWSDLVGLWKAYNAHLAHVIRHVDPRALQVQCRIGDYPPVTLQFLMEDYVVHLKHHLAKIGERVEGGK